MPPQPKLAAGAVQRINQFIFIPDAPVDADFTIVLGMTLWQRPLAAALALWRAGKAGKLIFTGGHNSRIGGSEANVMFEKARESGVDPACLLCEPHATHTRENMAFSWTLLQSTGAPVKAINIVAIQYHVRRALLTARGVIPAEVQLGHSSYPSIHFSPDDWHQSERGRRDVLSEAEKLARYFPQQTPSELDALFS